MDLQSRVVRSDTAIAAEIDDQLVALDVAAGVCYGLNSVATRIWQLIEAPTTVAEVCDKLQQEFDVDPQACESETLALLDDLVGAGLAR